MATKNKLSNSLKIKTWCSAQEGVRGREKAEPNTTGTAVWGPLSVGPWISSGISLSSSVLSSVPVLCKHDRDVDVELP